ncbi:unnamed protein product, partial [Trichobilharzia regenti]
YIRYPLGDGQSTNLIETLVQQAELFSPNYSSKYFNLTESPSDSINSEINDSISPVKLQQKDQKLNWEKKSFIALETLKKVRQSWWGPKRVDYSVHCPEAIQNILARALPPILHASYWESKDVASFIIRQLLETMGLSILETAYSADMADEIAVTELAKVSLNPLKVKSQTYDVSEDSSTQISQHSGKSSNQSKFSNFSHSLTLGPRNFLKRTSSERLKGDLLLPYALAEQHSMMQDQNFTVSINEILDIYDSKAKRFECIFKLSIIGTTYIRYCLTNNIEVHASN